MAHEARTRPLPGTTPPVVRSEHGHAVGRLDAALEGLWHLLTSMRFGVVLILLIAVLGVVGSLVIQAPPGVLLDPEAKTSWLNEIRPKYGAWTGLMDQVQLFEIFTSVYFRLLVAALTISLIACTVHRLPGLWHTAVKPRVDVGPAFFEHAPEHEAVVVRHSPAETLSLVQDVLAKRRYRTLATDDGVIHLYADRFRWGPFASLAGHLSLVVILAGAIVGSTFGFRDGQFTVAEGARLAVAAEPGLELELIDFKDTYYATTGAPEDYASDVVLYDDGREVLRHTIRVNDPLRYEGVTFYQAFFGQAAVMSVADSTGTPVVASQGVPMAWRTTADNRAIGSFSIPGSPYVGWIIGTLGSGDPVVKPGQMRLEVYSTEGAGSQVEAKTIDQGVPTEIAGLTFTFERESQFTGLSVARDPGVVLVWLGCLLMIVGFVIVFFLPHRRVWARIVPRSGGGSTLAVASLSKRDTTLVTGFESLMSDIRAALQAPARS